MLIPWEACPHLMPPYLPKEALEDFEKTLAPHQREARRTGRPYLGAGAIYQVALEELLVEPFEIPSHWWQGCGMDVGWNATALVKGAYDPDADVIYLTNEYKEGHKVPALHIHGIRAMLPWETCLIACDPAANAANQEDGSKLFQKYSELGLHLRKASNARWAGIFECTNRMQTGRLKFFRTLTKTKAEFRLYRTEKRKGIAGETIVIVKENDHLMDAMRYLVFTQGILLQRPTSSDYLDDVRYGDF